MVHQGGVLKKHVPILLYHEANDVYGLVVTSVRANLSDRPLDSMIHRFRWTPEEMGNLELLSTIVWNDGEPNSQILHGVNTEDELIVLATRPRGREGRKPLVLARFPREPSVTKMNWSFGSMTTMTV